MRVLLTGGAGFIGRHVLAELLQRGDDVVVFDSLRDDVHHGATPDLGVPLLVGDVRDPIAVRGALLHDGGFDAVCHLAAKVGLGVNVADLPDYADSNDRGTAVLLAEMAQTDIVRLTLASSMVVYGEGLGLCGEHGAVTPAPRRESDLKIGRFEPPCPYCGQDLAPALVDEQARLDPRNAYAASKLAQEHLASAWARSTGGVVAAMRYHNVYGPGMPKDTPYAGVAAIFLSRLRNGQAPLVFEDGGQRRDFIHVRDVAAATVAALHGHREGVRAFNVGSGKVRTVGKMARALAEAVDGPMPEITGSYRLGDVRHITADSSRLQVELGVTTAMSFKEGMSELAQQFS